MRKSLTKRERISKRSDLKRVFGSQRQVSLSGAKLKVRENGLEWSRLAISLSRRFGNAVQRNRAKRVVRETYRNLKGDLLPGYDVAVILYPNASESVRRRDGLEYLFRKAGLLETSPSQFADSDRTVDA